jgi:hypothetical protein
MIVHAKGPQKITLSPPIYKCGLNSVINEKKSKFNPIANGIFVVPDEKELIKLEELGI